MSARFVNVEFHCHSMRSVDGMMPHDALLRAAGVVGLDVVAITDHDTVEGAFELRQLVQERSLPLQIIVGEERTLDDGSHFIGLFLERAIVARNLAGAIAEITEQGGLCLIPHPFRKKDGLLRNGLEPLKLLEGKVAGFELFSAKCSYEENRRSAELLESCRLAPFGGSDAHYECDLGECVNRVEWTGDLRASIQRMFQRQGPFEILGKGQETGARERSYAALYHRVKKYVGLPKLLVPAARDGYRRYRNWKFGIGRKPLREIYRHA
jgi:predicted metal-dependent phosphoesterase TrpH